MTTNKEPARNPPVQVDPDLGVMRTMMAADRTLMAWIRTSLSMFTVGRGAINVRLAAGYCALALFPGCSEPSSVICLLFQIGQQHLNLRVVRI